MRNYFALFLASLLLFQITSCSLKERAERTYRRNITKGPYDAIIVPGYPYKSAEHSELVNMRIYWAKELYDRGIAKNIIFSGAAVHTAYVEGQIMKTIADSLGIPSNHTFAEKQAMHSNENAFYGAKMAHGMGYKKVAIATDPFQFNYMQPFEWFNSPRVVLIPIPLDSVANYIRPLPKFDERDAHVADFIPLEQRKN